MNNLIKFIIISTLFSLNCSMRITIQIDSTALSEAPQILAGNTGRFRIKLAKLFKNGWEYENETECITNSNNFAVVELPQKWEELFAKKRTNERIVLAVKIDMAEKSVEPIPFSLSMNGQKIAIKLVEKNGVIVGIHEGKFKIMPEMLMKIRNNLGQQTSRSTNINILNSGTATAEGSESGRSNDEAKQSTKKQILNFQMHSTKKQQHSDYQEKQQMNQHRKQALAQMPHAHYGIIQSGPTMPMPNLHPQVLSPLHPAWHSHYSQRFASQAQQLENREKLLMAQDEGANQSELENTDFHGEGNIPQNLPINSAGQHHKRHGKGEMPEMNKNNPEYWRQMQAKLMESAMNPGQMGHQNFGNFYGANRNLGTGSVGQHSESVTEKFNPNDLYSIQHMQTGLHGADIGNVHFWSEGIHQPMQFPQINQIGQISDSKGKRTEGLHQISSTLPINEEIGQNRNFLNQLNSLGYSQGKIMASNEEELHGIWQQHLPNKKAKTSSSTVSDVEMPTSFGQMHQIGHYQEMNGMPSYVEEAFRSQPEYFHGSLNGAHSMPSNIEETSHGDNAFVQLLDSPISPKIEGDGTPIHNPLEQYKYTEEDAINKQEELMQYWKNLEEDPAKEKSKSLGKKPANLAIDEENPRENIKKGKKPVEGSYQEIKRGKAPVDEFLRNFPTKRRKLSKGKELAKKADDGRITTGSLSIKPVGKEEEVAASPAEGIDEGHSNRANLAFSPKHVHEPDTVDVDDYSGYFGEHDNLERIFSLGARSRKTKKVGGSEELNTDEGINVENNLAMGENQQPAATTSDDENELFNSQQPFMDYFNDNDEIYWPSDDEQKSS